MLSDEADADYNPINICYLTGAKPTADKFVYIPLLKIHFKSFATLLILL